MNNIVKKQDLFLSEGNRADFGKSGINEDTLKSWGTFIRTITREEASSRLGFTAPSGGWWLSYPELLENKASSYGTFKPDTPLINEGKPVKYLRPKGETSRIFRPLELEADILQDATKPLFITEGEKKAIKATQEGFNCIGVAGVWCWKSKHTDDSVIEDLKAINWKNRTVYIIPDNDYHEKTQVLNAFVKLGLKLASFGANAKLVSIPACNNEKLGLDDYLIKLGSNKLSTLISGAVDINANTAFKLLNQEEKIEFPINALPEKVRLLTENASKIMDAPKEFIACSIISGAFALLSSKAKVSITNTWIEPCISWMILCAKPSLQAKSPCFKLVKKLIDEIDENLLNDYNSQKADYETQLAVYDKELKIWKNKQDSEALPAEPARPFRELIYTSDTTTESLKDLQSKNQRGISVINDEISSLLRSMNQYKKGGNDEQYWLSSWSADRITCTRKGEKEPVTLVPHHNIFGTTQPTEVEKLILTDINSSNGFAERWLFALSDHERSGRIIKDDIDQSMLDEMKQSFKRLYDIEETFYYFSKEAFEAFEMASQAYFNTIKLPTTSNMMKSYLSKQNSYIARFAMVLHCLENPYNREIGKESVICAIELSSYFIDCFKKVSKITVDIKNNSLEDYSLEWMKTKDIYEVSPTILYKSNKSKFKGIDEAKETLQNLASMGYGELLEKAKGLKFILFQS